MSQRSTSSKAAPTTTTNCQPSNLIDVISVCIPQTEDVVTPFGRHTKYFIEVSCAGKTISTCRRYKQFAQLAQSLDVTFPDQADTLPQLPPKRFFGSSDPIFIEERRLSLEHYLRSLFSEEVVVHSDYIWHFVDADEVLVVFSRFLTVPIPSMSTTPVPSEYCPVLAGEFGGGLPRASRLSQPQQAFYAGHILGLVHRLFVINQSDHATALLTIPTVVRRLIKFANCATAEVLTRICLILRMSSFSENSALLDVLAKEGALGAVLGHLEESLEKWGSSSPLQFLNASRVFCVNLVRAKPSSVLFFFSQQAGLAHCLRLLSLTSPLATVVLHPLVGLLLWLALTLPEVQMTLSEQGDSLGLEVLGALYRSPNVTARLISGLVLSALLKSRRFESRDSQANGGQDLSSDTSLKAASSVEMLPKSIQEDSCRQLKSHPVEISATSQFAGRLPPQLSHPPTVVLTADPLREAKSPPTQWMPPETPREPKVTSSCGFLGPLWYASRSPDMTSRAPAPSMDESTGHESVGAHLESVGNPWMRIESSEIDYFYLLVLLQGEGAARVVSLLSNYPESKEVIFFVLWVIALVAARPQHMHTTGTQRKRPIGDEDRAKQTKALDECHSLSPTRSTVGLRIAAMAGSIPMGPTFVGTTTPSALGDRRVSNSLGLSQPLLATSHKLTEYSGHEPSGNSQDIHLYPHSSLTISLQNSFLFDDSLLPSSSSFGHDPTNRFLAAAGDPIESLVKAGVLLSLENLVQWGRTPGIRALAAVSLLHIPWVTLDKAGGPLVAHANVKGRWARRPSLPSLTVDFPDALLELRIKIRNALVEYLDKQLDASRVFLRVETDRLVQKEDCVLERQSVEILGLSQLKSFTEMTWDITSRRSSLSDAVGNSRSFLGDMRSRLEAVAMTRSGLKEQAKVHQGTLRDLAKDLGDADKALVGMREADGSLNALKLQADDILRSLMEKSQNVRQLTENLRAVRRQAAHHRERWIELERVIAAAPTKRQQILDQIRLKSAQRDVIGDKLNQTKGDLISEQSKLASAASEAKSLDASLVALEVALARLKATSASDVESPGSTSALGELARELPESAVDDNIRDFVSSPGPMGSAAARLRETLENRIDFLQRRRADVLVTTSSQKNVRELAATHRSLETEHHKLSSELAGLESQLSAHGNQENLTRRSEELHASVRATEAEVATRSTELSEAEAECRAMEKELESLRSRIRTCEAESQGARERVGGLVRTSNESRAVLGRELVEEEGALRNALCSSVALREDCLYVSSNRLELDILLVKEKSRREEYRRSIRELMEALERVDRKLATIDDEPLTQIASQLPAAGVEDEEETLAVFV